MLHAENAKRIVRNGGGRSSWSKAGAILISLSGGSAAWQTLSNSCAHSPSLALLLSTSACIPRHLMCIGTAARSP
jgi:hypothetical protein